VSREYFDVLGVRALTGRVLSATFRSPDERAVAVVGEELWRTRYHSSPGLVGSTVYLNKHPLTIIGVVSDSFRGMNMPTLKPSDIWVPFDLAPELASNGLRQRDILTTFRVGSAQMAGRLRPRVGLTAAQLEIDSLIKGAEAEAAVKAGSLRVEARRADDVHLSPTFDPYALAAAYALGVITVTLLGALCVNLTNLFLARGMLRERDMAISRSLGATTADLVRLQLGEYLLLAGIGGLVGLALSRLGILYVIHLLPHIDLIHQVSLHLTSPSRVAAVSVCMSIGAGLVAGLVPAIRLARTPLARLLDTSNVVGGGATGLVKTRFLLSAQIALSTAVVVAGWVCFRAAAAMELRDIGLGSPSVAIVGLSLRPDRELKPEQIEAVAGQMMRAVAALPTTRHVALFDWLPIGISRNPATIVLEGGVRQRRVASFARVSPNYFYVVHTPIVQGRAFSDSDAMGAPRVAVVSQLAANKLWPNQDPIGQRLRLDLGGPELTVVGIAKDTDVRFIGSRDWLFVYVPFAQDPTLNVQLAVDTAAPVQDIPAIVDAASAVAPDAPLLTEETLSSYLGLWLLPYRLLAAITGVGALGAFLICTVGVYSLVAHIGSRRTREIGIRLACGGTPRSVVVPLVRGVLLTAAVGNIAGLGASVVLLRALRGHVFGLYEASVGPMACAALVLLGVSLIAAYLPARRAAGLDPNQALRSA
jgi:putative ABC transport system permease protein